jgi:hypothetical protein
MSSKLHKHPATFLVGAVLIQLLIYLVLYIGMGETTRIGGKLAGILTIVFAILAVATRFKPAIAITAPILFIACAVFFILTENFQHFAYDPNALIIQFVCLAFLTTAAFKARKFAASEPTTSASASLENDSLSTAATATLRDGTDYNKKATALLIATYIFTALGGFLGFIFGFHIFAARAVLPDGTKVKKYKKSHRIAGLVGGVLGIISFIAWKASI